MGGLVKVTKRLLVMVCLENMLKYNLWMDLG